MVKVIYQVCISPLFCRSSPFRYISDDSRFRKTFSTSKEAIQYICELGRKLNIRWSKSEHTGINYYGICKGGDPFRSRDAWIDLEYKNY